MPLLTPFERSGGQATERLEQSLAKLLDPIARIEFMSGQLVEGVNVTAAGTAIAHKLGRTPRGWFPLRVSGEFPILGRNPSPRLVRFQVFEPNVAGSPASAAFGLAVAPEDGNRLVFLLSGQAPSAANDIASITQTGVTWTKKANVENATAGTRIHMWYSNEVSGASQTFTVTAGGTGDLRGVLVVAEFAGLTEDADPFENITSGTSTPTGTAENYDLGNMALPSDNVFLWGAVCEQRPQAVCGPILVDGGGLHVIHRANAVVSGGTYTANQTAVIGGPKDAVVVGRSSGTNMAWNPTVPGGTTNGCAYLYGSLKPSTNIQVTGAHGLRQVSADNRFLTLAAPGDVTVDLWVF